MSKQLIYENPKLLDAKEVDNIISKADSSEICKMLAGVSLYSENFSFIENTILHCINIDNIDIESMCLTALSHLVRRYPEYFDQQKRLVSINGLKHKTELNPKITELISDIEFSFREVIETEILKQNIPEKSLSLQILKYEEDTKTSFCLYIIDESGTKTFNGEYQNLEELINDIQEEFGVAINLGYHENSP